MFKVQTIMVSYEDCGIRCYEDSIRKEKKNIGVFDNRINIMLLRDPFNLFASRFKHKDIREHTLKKSKFFKKIWKQYAMEYLGETDTWESKYCVSYNQFIKDEPYRRKIEKDLNLPETDKGINIVSGRGHASSFDGFKFKKRGYKMQTATRWKLMMKDKEYVRFMKDKEMYDLSVRIFGNINGIKDGFGFK